jgi:hypothetical protein
LKSKASVSLKSHITYLALALGLTIFIYWLSSEFRPDGILGTLQVFFQFTVIVPYIVGAIFGSDAHNPNAIAFFIALFIQLYLIVLLVRFIVLRMKK